METVKDIYYKIKLNCELPVAMLSYIIFDGKIYNFNSLCVSFREDNAGIKSMEKVASEDYFYAFVNSEKGKDFVKKNKQQITKVYSNMVLQNAGYGFKVCKN